MSRSKTESAATRLIYAGDQAKAISVSAFSLRVIAGPGKGREVKASAEEALIGSANGCHLVLGEDDAVSRSHAVISACEHGFRLRDLGSTNGTWLGGVRVESAIFTDETDFTVGCSRIRFKPLRERVEVPLSQDDGFGELLGCSAAMREVFAKLARVAPTEISLLLEGESGTGKELAARAVHQRSKRTAGPYEIFDCAAVAPTVIESELFGHEKGAFTGALQLYRGVFERASGGTLFIDEIGELRSELQPKLLRALESGEFRRVGGSLPVRVDVRVIAATNRDLRPMVNSGAFRLDLYFRLAGARVVMPPLRERAQDIPLLVRAFASSFAERSGVPAPRGILSDETVELLGRHYWPGNARELRQFVDQALALAELAELPAMPQPQNASAASADGLPLRTDLPYKEARELLLDAFCRRYFEAALARNKFNITKLAEEAEIDRVYAMRVIKKYGLK